MYTVCTSVDIICSSVLVVPTAVKETNNEDEHNLPVVINAI